MLSACEWQVVQKTEISINVYFSVERYCQVSMNGALVCLSHIYELFCKFLHVAG